MISPPRPEAQIVVDPEAMLTVVIDTPNGPRIVNAINCRYVPAVVEMQPGPHPRRVVAVEVIHDPNNPIPVEAYICNRNLLLQELHPAGALRHVRPYEVPPFPAVPTPSRFG